MPMTEVDKVETGNIQELMNSLDQAQDKLFHFYDLIPQKDGKVLALRYEAFKKYLANQEAEEEASQRKIAEAGAKAYAETIAKKSEVEEFYEKQVRLKRLEKTKAEDDEDLQLAIAAAKKEAEFRLKASQEYLDKELELARWEDQVDCAEKTAAIQRLNDELAAMEASAAAEAEQRANDARNAEMEALRAQLAEKVELAGLGEQEITKLAEQELRKREAAAKKAQEEAEKEADKKEKKKKEKEKEKAAEQAGKTAVSTLFDKNASGADRAKALKEAREAARELNKASSDVNGKNTVGAGAGMLVNAISDLSKQLENKIDTIAGYKSTIDTYLQGSKNEKSWSGSYWEQISKDIVGVAGVSPLVRQEDIVNNIKSLVTQGIAFDVEQRGFLATIKDKIAATFDVTDTTLRRLIRIQQQDSTANRLGMESMMTTFLNSMYETSEYMSEIAKGVRSSLQEAQALMGAAQSSELEFEVQKWLGSMYSVGMSDTAVNNIASAIGKLAAGQMEGITGGGVGNLVVMAANEAGLSVADILQKGLDAKTTNNLLRSMVSYLSKIYAESQDSKVVQQQIANVYGMTASDLKAVTNLLTAESAARGQSSETINAIYGLQASYDDMLGQLNSMAASMYSRTSIGEMMTNAWQNVQYTMAASIANNPVLYAMYKVAGLLDTAVGGIAIPAISIMGNMVDLHTTVADLMRVGAMAGGIMSGIGQMIAAGGGGGLSGSGMLKALNINGTKTVSRGTKSGLTAKGNYTSESGSTMVGNEEGGSVQDKTMADAADSKKSQMAEEQESNEDKDWKRTEFFDALNGPSFVIVGTLSNIYKSLGEDLNGQVTLLARAFSLGAANGIASSGNKKQEVTAESPFETMINSLNYGNKGLDTINLTTKQILQALNGNPYTTELAALQSLLTEIEKTTEAANKEGKVAGSNALELNIQLRTLVASLKSNATTTDVGIVYPLLNKILEGLKPAESANGQSTEVSEKTVAQVGQLVSAIAIETSNQDNSVLHTTNDILASLLSTAIIANNNRAFEAISSIELLKSLNELQAKSISVAKTQDDVNTSYAYNSIATILSDSETTLNNLNTTKEEELTNIVASTLDFVQGIKSITTSIISAQESTTPKQTPAPDSGVQTLTSGQAVKEPIHGESKSQFKSAGELIIAAEEDSKRISMSTNNGVLGILDILERVASGELSFKVTTDNKSQGVSGWTNPAIDLFKY